MVGQMLVRAGRASVGAVWAMGGLAAASPGAWRAHCCFMPQGVAPGPAAAGLRTAVGGGARAWPGVGEGRGFASRSRDKRPGGPRKGKDEVEDEQVRAKLTRMRHVNSSVYVSPDDPDAWENEVDSMDPSLDLAWDERVTTGREPRSQEYEVLAEKRERGGRRGEEGEGLYK